MGPINCAPNPTVVIEGVVIIMGGRPQISLECFLKSKNDLSKTKLSLSHCIA